MPLSKACFGAVLLAAGVALSGCGPKVALVKDVPLPPFGGRHDARTAPAGQARAAAVTMVDWTPTVAERKWRFIIVHHSATSAGDAAKFDRDHRDRGWDGLGYHFVIGNGTMSGDGEIEIGPRWAQQKHGAHTKVRGHPEYNELGVGICLVGNFNETRPSQAQRQSLVALVRGLMQRYHIPKSRVLGHGMLAPTDCPGKQFDYQDLFNRL